jgi:butyryl-CoA dehydrogenase
MSIFFSEEQIAIRDSARRFSDLEIEPVADEIDRTGIVPAELESKAAALGFFALYTPREYGGNDANLTSACLMLEEIGRASPGYAGMLNVQIVISPAAVVLAGTAEQKRRLLPDSAGGRNTIAFAVTEPGGARNRIEHQTYLTRDGGGYRLNGGKILCTLGESRYILVSCKTEQDGMPGYGRVIVDRAMEGVHVTPSAPMIGWAGTNNSSISFENVRISSEDILGDILRVNTAEASWASNIGHAASSLGGAQGMFEKTLRHVRKRNLYGLPMDRVQPVSYRLAEIYGSIQACRALLHSTTLEWDAGQRDGTAASTCKALICDMTFELAHALLQLWGGSGMTQSTGINRYFRDLRASMAAEGPSDLHYDYVAAHLLDKIPDAARAG